MPLGLVIGLYTFWSLVLAAEDHFPTACRYDCPGYLLSVSFQVDAIGSVEQFSSFLSLSIMISANEHSEAGILVRVQDSNVSIERLQCHSIGHKRIDTHNSSPVMGLKVK